MGKAQRVKGHSWEREVCIKLREIDPTAKRQLEYQEGLGVDVCTTLPLAIQCKCTKKPNFIAAFKEAQNMAKDRIPIALVKVDHKGEFALIEFSFLLDLLKKFYT